MFIFDCASLSDIIVRILLYTFVNIKENEMRRLVIDLGNSIVKATNGRQEVTMQHGLVQLTQSEYEHATYYTDDSDYVIVNGQHYAVGAAAERHGLVSPLQRAAKYTKSYYGVLMAATMPRLWDTDGNIAVYASHAPGDFSWRMALLEAIGHDWTVTCEGKTRNFHIHYANTWEEPIGGVMNVILAEDGAHYRNQKIAGSRTIVIDVGGGSTDICAVLGNGSLDGSLQDSFDVGIGNVYSHLEKSLKDKHPKFFTSTSGALPIGNLREAVRTGVYADKGHELDCASEVQEARNILMNKIANSYATKARGGAGADYIVLTGGGPVDIRPQLVEMSGFAEQRVVDAEEAPFMHLANVRGALKMMLMYEALGGIRYA